MIVSEFSIEIDSKYVPFDNKVTFKVFHALNKIKGKTELSLTAPVNRADSFDTLIIKIGLLPTEEQCLPRTASRI
jgi:hypothetical protein